MADLEKSVRDLETQMAELRGILKVQEVEKDDLKRRIQLREQDAKDRQEQRDADERKQMRAALLFLGSLVLSLVAFIWQTQNGGN